VLFIGDVGDGSQTQFAQAYFLARVSLSNEISPFNEISLPSD
jgi:hypothetical protein